MGKIARIFVVLLVVAIALSIPVRQANASYKVKNMNVTIMLNTNTSAQITEELHVSISNESVKQYSTNRVALNLTLSEWQQLIGPTLVEHIINPNTSIYNFRFLPGPVTTVNGQHTANIIFAYNVSNITTVSQIAPREFQYKFNQKAFNFEHGVSGEVLTPNTTLTIMMPQGGQIESVYPIPDLPPYSFTNQYKNVTQVSWLYAEPLSTFTFVFNIRESIPSEVEGFFGSLYKTLGLTAYAIVALAILLSILYIYRKATK